MNVLPFPTQGATALAPMFVCPGCDKVITPSNERIQRADGVYMHSDCAGAPFILPDGSRSETPMPAPNLVTRAIEPDDAADLLHALDDVTSAGILPDGRTRKMWFQRRDEAGLPVGSKIMLVGESFEAVLRKYARHSDQRRAIERAGRAS